MIKIDCSRPITSIFLAINFFFHNGINQVQQQQQRHLTCLRLLSDAESNRLLPNANAFISRRQNKVCDQIFLYCQKKREINPDAVAEHKCIMLFRKRKRLMLLMMTIVPQIQCNGDFSPVCQTGSCHKDCHHTTTSICQKD